MTPFVDVHSHVTPLVFTPAPTAGARDRWPCMQCHSSIEATLLMGEMPFRKLDNRSWNMGRRLEDMDRDEVALQVLSPMPELLSYWMTPDEAAVLCDTTNHQIAELVAAAPCRFRGLGSVPMQDPRHAAAALPKMRAQFGLSGVEIGSNVNGVMLGDPCFDPFWAAAESEGLAVFVHALHPVAAQAIASSPVYTALALFPIDVAMAAASLILAGVTDRFPKLRIAFSHGGGALSAILGRLDKGWDHTRGFAGKAALRPSDQARRMFYDSNVYDPQYLRHLVKTVVPNRVFGGTDYPYDIMQQAPAAFVRGLGIDEAALESLSIGAASAFLDEDLKMAVAS